MSASRIGIGLVAAFLLGCGWMVFSEALDRRRRDQSMIVHSRMGAERRIASLIASFATEELNRIEIMERIRASDDRIRTAAEIFREIGESVMKQNLIGEMQTSVNPDFPADRRDVKAFVTRVGDHRIGFFVKIEGESIVVVICPFKAVKLEIVTLSLQREKAVHDTWFILPNTD